MPGQLAPARLGRPRPESNDGAGRRGACAVGVKRMRARASPLCGKRKSGRILGDRPCEDGREGGGGSGCLVWTTRTEYKPKELHSFDDHTYELALPTGSIISMNLREPPLSKSGTFVIINLMKLWNLSYLHPPCSPSSLSISLSMRRHVLRTQVCTG